MIRKKQYLHQLPRILDGLDALLEKDPVFSKLDIRVGDFKWPYMGPEFDGLVRIVIGQQLSTKAADSLWERFQDEMPCITPNAILALRDDDMRGFGLSYQKASYIRGLAEAVKNKAFDAAALEDMDDEAVRAAITALKGFGDWSAQMYLMFGLARPDVWAPGDLGIQEGLRIYLKKKERPTPEQAEKYGERFKPHRTAASLLLWHLKGMG